MGIVESILIFLLSFSAGDPVSVDSPTTGGLERDSGSRVPPGGGWSLYHSPYPLAKGEGTRRRKGDEEALTLHLSFESRISWFQSSTLNCHGFLRALQRWPWSTLEWWMLKFEITDSIRSKPTCDYPSWRFS